MSRELDERVAVEVMGWERDEGTPKYPFPSWKLPHDDIYSHIECDMWRPSQSISQAFQVVERMRAEGFGAIITASPKQNRPDWAVSFVRSGESAVGRTQENPSLPTAICQAALAAKGSSAIT